MADLQEKLKAFRTQTKTDKVGIVLPRAFIARTKEAVVSIPAGVDVVVEPNVLGQFEIRWWNVNDQELRATVTESKLDMADVYAKARADLLAEISTTDLEFEIARRRSEGGDA